MKAKYPEISDDLLISELHRTMGMEFIEDVLRATRDKTIFLFFRIPAKIQLRGRQWLANAC